MMRGCYTGNIVKIDRIITKEEYLGILKNHASGSWII